MHIIGQYMRSIFVLASVLIILLTSYLFYIFLTKITAINYAKYKKDKNSEFKLNGNDEICIEDIKTDLKS